MNTADRPKKEVPPVVPHLSEEEGLEFTDIILEDIVSEEDIIFLEEDTFNDEEEINGPKTLRSNVVQQVMDELRKKNSD